jgi:GNAT superfamily N-acetyltransferase
MADTLIRRAHPADAVAIAAIHVAATRATYRGIYTEDYLASISVDAFARMWTTPERGHLVNEHYRVFVAFKEGVLIGFADVGPAGADPSIAELFAIYLDPIVIGSGIGAALFRACAQYAAESGYSSMSATVLARNHVARAFYERVHGRPDPASERRVQGGGVAEMVITYCWTTP